MLMYRRYIIAEFDAGNETNRMDATWRGPILVVHNTHLDVGGYSDVQQCRHCWGRMKSVHQSWRRASRRLGA
jgi:hypothetical protein